MEKPWFPQRNSKDHVISLLRTLFYHLGVRISQPTIESLVKDHSEFPALSDEALNEIFHTCGLDSFTVNWTELPTSELRPFSLLFIDEIEGNIKSGQFVISTKLTGDSIEYLHTRKGWITESWKSFNEKWSKIAIILSGVDESKWENDFEKREEEFIKEKFKHPDFNNIKLVDSFLSDEECDYIVNLANPILQPSKLFGDEREAGYGRTSYSAEFHIYPDDKILNGIRSKAAKLIELPESHFEFFQCVSYEQGQEYQVHYDTFDENIPSNKAEVERGGQRKYTMLAYLNDDYDGGGTFFPNLDFMVRPKKGRVVIFNNLDSFEKVIPAAFHAGLPVTKGRKYAINIWVRNRPQLL